MLTQLAKTLFCLLLLYFCFPQNVKAQMNPNWEIRSHFDFYFNPYFINKDYGFIFKAGRGGPHPWYIDNVPFQIHRTTDGGKSWTRCSTPGMGEVSQDMCFVTAERGYIALTTVTAGNQSGSLTGGGIYETLDSGKTWKLITPAGMSFTSVYAFGEVVLGTPGYQWPGKIRGIGTSLDRGKTWRWQDEQISSPQWGASIRGNQDGDVLSVGVWGGVDEFGAYSQDSGKTWKQTQAGPECWTSYVIPHSKYAFRASEAERVDGNEVLDDGEILRSTDGGMSWAICYKTPGLSPTGGMQGGGCRTVYVQRSSYSSLADSGLLRTTDLGATWKSVGGPPGWTDTRFSVTGNGAVVYVTDMDNNLWRTTNGGDGTLTSDPAGEKISARTRVGDTVRSRLCDSLLLTFRSSYVAECTSGQLGDLLLAGLDPSNYKIEVKHLSNGQDSIYVWIYPEVVGKSKLDLTLRFQREDFSSRDTTLSTWLVVDNNPGKLLLSGKSSIDFGTQSLCSPIKLEDSIRLSAEGCEPVTVESVRFESDDAQAGYSFADAVSFVLSPSAHRSFKVNFLPTKAGLFTGRIIVKSVGRDDTIHVSGEAVAESRSIRLQADTVVSSICDSVEMTLNLTNTSCKVMSVDSLTMVDPLSVLPGQLPLAIQAGKSIQLKLRVKAQSIGVQTASVVAHLRLVLQSGTINIDTVLPLIVNGLRGTAATVLSDTTIDVGKVSICSSAERTFGILSFGCDSLSVERVSLSSDQQGFTLTSYPVQLIASGGSGTIAFKFIPPGVGPYTTTLRIQTNAGERMVTLRGEGVAGDRILAASEQSIDLGQNSVCVTPGKDLTLTNNGCDTLTITSADMDGSFVLMGIDLPLKLAPGESRSIVVLSLIDTLGHQASSTGSLSFVIDADNAILPIALTRGYVYPRTIDLDLKLTTANSTQANSAHNNERVSLKLTSLGDMTDVTDMKFDLVYDADLLSHMTLSNGTIISSSPAGNGLTRTRLELVNTQGPELTTIDLLTRLSIEGATPITIENVRLNDTDAQFEQCVASVGTTGAATFSYLYDCSEHSLQKYLRSGELPLRIISIRPNPVDEKLIVEVESQSEVKIEVVDLLGKLIQHKVGAREITIDLSGLSSGQYLLSVSAGSSTQIRSLIKR